MSQIDAKAIKELIQLSLTNTRPYRLEFGIVDSATGLSGYVLQVEEAITITNIKCNVRGAVPTTLPIGVYYYKIQELGISAGKCTIYELETSQ